MAGGTGTRFWPLSRRDRPKQVLSLGRQKSMLAATIDRLLAAYKKENIFVITAREHQAPVTSACQQLPAENILGEPEGRDTAACAGWGGLIVRQKFSSDAVIGVFPADHQISPREKFVAAVESASRAASEQDCLVTFGIRPDFPSTGYGYINYFSDNYEQFLERPVHRVNKFTEKPERQQARHFLEQGDYLWNSGMFFWSAGRILSEIESFMPELYSGLEAIDSTWKEERDWEKAASEHYSSLPEISVDYGILERSARVWTLPVDFNWTDLGTWDALEDLFESDEDNNIKVGPLETIQSENNILVSADGPFIGCVDVEGLIVVSTEDAVLICDRDQAQKVKTLVNKLDAKGYQELL